MTDIFKTYLFVFDTPREKNHNTSCLTVFEVDTIKNSAKINEVFSLSRKETTSLESNSLIWLIQKYWWIQPCQFLTYNLQIQIYFLVI